MSNNSFLQRRTAIFKIKSMQETKTLLNSMLLFERTHLSHLKTLHLIIIINIWDHMLNLKSN